MTIREAGNLLRSGKVSAVELVNESLAQIAKDEPLNAFITVTGDEARAHAGELDKELRAGHDRGPLHGIPIALKDLYYTRGVRTTNGSKLFSDFVPDHDATSVTLLKNAGAISVGKLNQHELAYGITSNNPHFGAVRNPWNSDCVPGGSSGGSGVAVATGAVFCGMGSDTGGSIRNPAAFCGVTGLKPTFGRVSRAGCFPLGFTLDTMGPLTRTVEDSALVMTAITGYDPLDETTRNSGGEDLTPPADASLAGVRVGVPENFYRTRLHPDVAAAYDRTLRILEAAKAVLVPVMVPDPEGLNIVARATLMSEATAAIQPYLHRRDEIGADVLALLDQGLLLAAAEYVNTQRLRYVFQTKFREMFREIDVLLTPCAPIPAPRIGQTTVLVNGEEEDTRLAATRFLRGVNPMGLPGLAIPCGLTQDQMPIGLQLIGPAWSERKLVTYGAALEREMPALRPGRSPETKA